MTDRSRAARPPAATAAPSGPRRRLILLVTLAALIVAGVGLYLLFFGGSTPTEVSLDDATAVLDGQTPGTASPAPGGDDGTDPADDDEGATERVDADGTWTVSTEIDTFDLAASTGTFVGYRIVEELSGIGVTEAVGRTPEVSGSLVVQGTTVSDVLVEGSLTELRSDRSQRDTRVERALDVGRHPVVRFTAPTFELPEPFADGSRVQLEVPGTLSAAGGEADVVATVAAERRGDLVVMAGSFQVALADLGVEAPTAPAVLGVEDTVTVEWQLYLVRN